MDTINLTESEFYTLNLINNVVSLTNSDWPSVNKLGMMLSFALEHKSKLSFENKADKAVFTEVVNIFQRSVVARIAEKEALSNECSKDERSYIMIILLPTLRDMYKDCEHFKKLVNI